MRHKDITFEWLSLLKRKNGKKSLIKVLPTGVRVERKLPNEVEEIRVTCPEGLEPINMDAVGNIRVIDPVYVHPTKPSFYISNLPLNMRG